MPIASGMGDTSLQKLCRLCGGRHLPGYDCSMKITLEPPRGEDDMTNTSEDLVRRLRKRVSDNLELGDHPALMEAEDAMLQAADLIEKLEREKEELADKSKAVPLSAYLEQGAELQTLARALVYLRRTPIPNDRELTEGEIERALTIATKRVNGE